MACSQTGSLTAVNRLKKDYMNLMKDPVPYVLATPMHDNVLEWHYVILGAPDTPYEGGVYHGRLVFPDDFPFRPPAIYMVTPSGRFEVNTRLCLSISDFHPESWNSSWTVSAILAGIVSFMNSNEGTVGAMNATDTERELLAEQSVDFNLKDALFCRLFPELATSLKDDLTEVDSAPSALSSARSSTADNMSECGNSNEHNDSSSNNDRDGLATPRTTTRLAHS